MIKSRVSDIKRERKKSVFFREMIDLVRELAEKEAAVAQVYVSHIDISSNSGVCYVYFATFKEPGQDIFDSALDVLKLYKPSLRKAFAQRIKTRYAPELIFLYDKAKEKERRINQLLDKVQDDLADQPK